MSKVILSFKHGEDVFEYREFFNYKAIFLNNKEIGRGNQNFAIPFFSVINTYGEFINKNGEKVKVRIANQHTPFLKTYSVYFDTKFMYEKTKVAL